MKITIAFKNKEKFTANLKESKDSDEEEIYDIEKEREFVTDKGAIRIFTDNVNYILVSE